MVAREGNRERWLKGYEFSLIRAMWSEDLMYNVVTTVDNAGDVVEIC